MKRLPGAAKRMEQIVFLDRRSIQADFRRPGFAHSWKDYANTVTEDVVDRIGGATIVITNKAAIPGGALERAPHLKLIAVCATGTNPVDLEACRARGVRVCNVRHYAMNTLPEHTFALILALRRNLIRYHEAVRAGAWQKAENFCLRMYEIEDLHGSTLGIVGYGGLGGAVGRLGEAFGMRLRIADRKGAARVRPGRVPFDDVIRESDVITLHLPLTPETHHLIGGSELAMMRANALLINTARGGIVDEVALTAALKNGQIAGAALDVLSEEPPRSGNLLLDEELPNLLLTPHNAWASRQAMQTMADQLIENLEGFVRGDPRNMVV
jgi:glycerate dehydrogenase